MTDRLGRDEQQTLLRLARASLRQELRDDRSLDELLPRVDLTPALREPRGAFVTLKQRSAQGAEKLRGCLGAMGSRRPLYRNVIRLVTQSALEDPRFSPMTADELSGVRIEISALTPMRTVSDADEIEVGRHGVELKKGAARAVFLPQVAGDHGWSRATLLSQLARKAGLPDDGWLGAHLRVFEAEVFGEPGPED